MGKPSGPKIKKNRGAILHPNCLNIGPGDLLIDRPNVTNYYFRVTGGEGGEEEVIATGVGWLYMSCY
jgi:hypothetical protein